MTKLPLRRIVWILEIAFSMAAAFAGAFLLFALLPLEGNYKLMVVQSGSMEPTIPLGSLVLVVPRSEYTVGDVVTFAPSEKETDKYVTHRLVGFADDTIGLLYETKGDANDTADPGSLAKEKIVGKISLVIPFVGFIFHKMKTPLGFIAIVIVPATIVIYEELKKIYQVTKSGIQHYFSHKRKTKVVLAGGSPNTVVTNLNGEDRVFLQEIGKLRQAEEVTLDSRLGVALLFFGLSFAFVGMTHGFFSDTESASASIEAGVSSASPTPLPAHIVINEVFYDVDPEHGLDSPGDRGVTVGGHVTQVRIENNGDGSTNSAFVDIETLCSVVQNNQTEADIDLDVSGNSGDNTAFGNLLGDPDIESGDVANSIVVDIQGGSNTLSGFCGGALGRNHEWIELYNPTTETVNLKDWTITDNSGIAVEIPGNRNLGPGEFALISKSNSTWAFWSEPAGTLKIPLGKQIGDGLDDAGDHLILKDDEGMVVDAMSYGDDTSEFSLSGVAEGHSLERQPDGVDTDTAGDWDDQDPPAPGT